MNLLGLAKHGLNNFEQVCILSVVIVAFISFFVWFNLIHTYSVSRLSSFTFFGPIFGVVFGTIFLGEEFTFSVMIGLPMVCLGIFLVNWRKAVP